MDFNICDQVYTYITWLSPTCYDYKYFVKDGGGTIDVEEITEIVLGCFRMAGIEKKHILGTCTKMEKIPNFST